MSFNTIYIQMTGTPTIIFQGGKLIGRPFRVPFRGPIFHQKGDQKETFLGTKGDFLSILKILFINSNKFEKAKPNTGQDILGID